MKSRETARTCSLNAIFAFIEFWNDILSYTPNTFKLMGTRTKISLKYKSKMTADYGIHVQSRDL